MRPRVFILCSQSVLELSAIAQELLEDQAEVTVWECQSLPLSVAERSELIQHLEVVDFAVALPSCGDLTAGQPLSRSALALDFGLLLGRLGRERSFLWLERQCAGAGDELKRVAQVSTYDLAREDHDSKAALGPATNTLRRTIHRLPQRAARLASAMQGAISCSYLDTPWPALLENAKRVTLSLFYTSRRWNIRFRDAFREYLRRGGELDLYLPAFTNFAPLFGSSTKTSGEVSAKIIRTIKMAVELNAEQKGILRLSTLSSGFNYMMARIERKDNSALFILSPYPNDFSRSGPPVIPIEENHMNPDVREFITSELRYLLDLAESVPDFEELRFAIWRADRKRVFLSTSLQCPAGCKFCYVPSLVRPRADLRQGAEISQLCTSIVTSEHFEPGPSGTIIMVGAFNDPFEPQSVEATRWVLRFFAEFGNFVHLSTRYGVPKDLTILGAPSDNVVINFSLSCMSAEVELGNFDARFASARRVNEAGFKTALFLRPVIQERTIADLDEIVSRAKHAGFKVVTIGGLYVDRAIRKRLQPLVPELDQLAEIDKTFVLDDQRVLRKLSIPDIDIIRERFTQEGFATFLTSDDRVEYFARGGHAGLPQGHE